MKNKKPAPMADGLVPLKPVSKAEHRRLSKLIESRDRKLRKKYPEVHSKRVDWIDFWHEEGLFFFTVRFTDGKEFGMTCRAEVVTTGVDFSDMSSGDDVILREYYRRRED
jgi:hypothetical protein